MKQLSTVYKLFATTLLTTTLAGGIAVANDRYNGPVTYNSGYQQNHNTQAYAYDPHSREFRSEYVFKVYVDVQSGKKGRADKLEYLTLETIAQRLPYGVQLVRDPHYADLVIRANERNYDANFRVVDVDHKDKKYKKRLRYNAGYGECGGLYKAHYKKVEERGTGYYDYGVRIRMKGYGRDRTRISGRVREKYSYGTDLKAQTNCGLRPTNVFPSGKVARLFERSHPSYRKEVRRELRREAACDLGLKIAYIIKDKANYYYEDLAENLARQAQEYGNYEGYDGRRYGNRKGHHNGRQ
ncbi:hypothetical protein [Kordiimonas sp. SCSIO 12610]|uniref:hypothetical protein n=1 Tax=Kordiimonas sp. SCSIO 12610 TaxID=2829597 RepID=UPI00210EF7C0|nr:hypothetical protein [Kordiimonas sp. SCSIO 12610]UTW55730.1 hypothetical protein KFF44_02235 [Kordiimonas sp. SCSIO 12610]